MLTLTLTLTKCAMPNGSDATFALELRQRFETHASFAAPLRAPLAFTIRHYAGEVTYLSTGFCAKNKVTDKVRVG